MKLIKKVSATPVQENTGAIIDSLNTSDDKHTNAPSINAIKTYIDNEISDVNTDLAQCVVKGDIAVVTGSKTLDAHDSSSSADYKQTNWHISYPSGFNRNNCIVLSFGGTIDDSTNTGAYGFSPFSSSNLVLGTLPRGVSFLDEDMNVFYCNPSFQTRTLAYKLVLMKVS